MLGPVKRLGNPGTRVKTIIVLVHRCNRSIYEESKDDQVRNMRDTMLISTYPAATSARSSSVPQLLSSVLARCLEYHHINPSSLAHSFLSPTYVHFGQRTHHP